MRSEILEFILFIFKNLKKVIYSFYIKGEYNLFDPHVGDTACQIRACFLSEISKTVFDEYSPYKRIKKIELLHDNLLNIKENIKINYEKNNHQTICELTNNIRLNLDISEEEKILFQSYFLTKYKSKNEIESTVIDYDRISNELNISRKLSKKLTRSYQLSVASFSCKKIIQWACHVGTYNTNILKKLIRLDDDEREVLPCYLYTKVIIDYALKAKIPLYIISTKDNNIFPFYFKSNKDLTDFVYVENPKDDLDKPCIVITGHTKGNLQNYNKKFLSAGIKNILLSGMASHPQYMGKRLSSFRENIFSGVTIGSEAGSISKEINYKRLLANVLGCSYENQSLFVVHHIFCGAIYQQNLDYGLKLESTRYNKFKVGAYV